MNFIIKVFYARLGVTGLMMLLCPVISFAQPAPSLQAGTDKNAILIGEHFTFSIKATFPQDAFAITLPPVDSIDHFEIIDRKKIDTVVNSGIITCTQDFILTSFDSGWHSLPQLLVNFDPYKDDTTFNVYTDSIRIKIAFSPADSVKTFHDIKPIIGVKDVIPPWVWKVAVLILTCLILLIRYLLMRKKKAKPTAIFDSTLTAYEEAMQALETLGASSLLQTGGFKEYHSKLSAIFKRYISRKQGYDLSGLTTSELLVRIDATTLGQNKFTDLANALRIGDAAKFAKYLPATDENELCLAVIINTVTEMNQDTKKMNV